jgi:hypothetical protein
MKNLKIEDKNLKKSNTLQKYSRQMKNKKILFIPNTSSLLRHLSVLIYYNG